MDTKRLQAAIKKGKATWEAGVTNVSELEAPAKKAHLGLVVDEATRVRNKAMIAALNQSVKAIPAAFAFKAPGAVDWRNHNGSNWVTPVKDQQSCGSCVSFATCGTIEARARIVCNDPALNLDLSENQLFFCGCGNCCDTGWNFEPALDFAQATGVAFEADSAYTPVNKPCPAAPPRLKITTWREVLPVPDRKQSLANKGPMVGGMAVFEDFYNYTGGIYQHVTGELLGYHAIVVVGYSDAEDCWICKNSWGTGFGEAGFFRIAYNDDSGMDTEFGFYEVDLACPTPAPQPPSTCAEYVPLLNQVLTAARSNYRLRSGLRYHVCNRGWRPWLGDSEITIIRNVLLILRECPQYREPFCRILR